MPPLAGFSDNPFRTRGDVLVAVKALLRPLLPYFSPGCARICIPIATGTHFDETAAQLEGYARPLWVVAALLLSGDEPDWDLIQPWIKGIEIGTNPEHPEFWGHIRDYDQKMVECEMISFLLLAAPKERLWGRLDPKIHRNIIAWLSDIQVRAMPAANWLWFRVFVNLALLKTCGVDTPTVRESLQSDLEMLDTFYVADGWSGDGLWRSAELDEKEWEIYKQTGRANALPNSRNMCYYSGSFAIQFSQLLYIRFAGDLDPERTERYRQQARDFGAGFWRYFDSQGAAIPFGRSLTYRFACGGFFAALALAGVDQMPAPLQTLGDVKGFLLRHLRWWARHSDNIFYPDGTLNIGWVYPNWYLAEDYNSPQSVYWALKSLIIVALDADHPFWVQPETPYPDGGGVSLVSAPQQILCNHPRGSHHFLLSFSQFIGIPFKASRAKYSKFAYSSAFGFSVPNGPVSLRQSPPDNMLAFSRDGGDTWAVKYKAEQAKFGRIMVCDEEVPIGTVSWYPWTDRSVVVTTTMIPPTSRWPDWHIRVHKIKATNSTSRVFLSEGGFAINSRQKGNHLLLPEVTVDEQTDAVDEGIIRTDNSVLVLNNGDAVGISIDEPTRTSLSFSMSAFDPEPNTNLMVSRSLIPLVEYDIEDGFKEKEEIILVAKVFAISAKASSMRKPSYPMERWLDAPRVTFAETRQSTNSDNNIYVDIS
ncbi:unnamed protein product [Clonostachys rhizophaga]|uniref:Uncharacterized protein n=1 Tax=Clonostachys rhizophaga TaxID=160324 RepID=A0A9N9VY06_9HYPO|nr:unnamed protein product [Clonostachys rhizophaga]